MLKCLVQDRFLLGIMVAQEHLVAVPRYPGYAVHGILELPSCREYRQARLVDEQKALETQQEVQPALAAGQGPHVTPEFGPEPQRAIPLGVAAEQEEL